MVTEAHTTHKGGPRNHLVVEDGVVTNVVWSEDDFGVTQGWIPVKPHPGIGWTTKDGVHFDQPVEEVKNGGESE